MSGNTFLASVLSQFYDIIYIALDLTVLTPLISRYKVEHERVFMAIESRDAKKAKELVMNHDRVGTEVLLKSMTE